MQVHKFTFDAQALQALPPDRLSAFLMLGLFMNDANWMRKLLIGGTQLHPANEPEEKARLILTLSVTKILAGKIHEGWNRLAIGSLAQTLGDLPPSPVVESLREKLGPRLGKDTLFHQIRVRHAAHYPHQLSLDGLPNIAREDVALYGTRYSGDVLSLISELCAVADMTVTNSYANSVDGLEAIIKEIVEVVGLYSDYLQEVLTVLITEWLPPGPQGTAIDVPGAPTIEQLQVRFFAAPPMPGSPEDAAAT